MALQKEIARVAEEKRKKLCEGLEDSVAMKDGMLPGQTYSVIEQDNINWDRVVSGITKATGGAGGMLIGASAIASGGGSMFIPGVGWCYGLPAILSGLAAAGTGGATFIEGIQDIWHGLTGSNSSAQNFIRDTAFKDNEDYYYLLEFASQYTAGVTGSQANQINSAYNSAQTVVKVGQWMSKSEYDDFLKTGKIPRTNVLTKGKEGYYKQANKGDFYVEFDMDPSLLVTKNDELGWSLVKSKNAMYIKLAEKKGETLPDPIGSNIEHIYTK